jgi:hypothetical protein
MYNDPAIPVTLERELRDLKQRIRSLERRNSLQRAAANQPDGTSRIQIGQISHPYSKPDPGDEDFGLIVRNEDGTPVFMVDGGGALIPGLQSFIQNGDSSGASAHFHSSTSWTDALWYPYFVGLTGTVVSISLNIKVGAGISSAQARLVTQGVNSGDKTSNPIALTASGSFVSYVWHWDIDSAVNPNDVWYLSIDTRITGGAGDIDVYQPRWCVLRSAVAIATNVTGP